MIHNFLNMPKDREVRQKESESYSATMDSLTAFRLAAK